MLASGENASNGFVAMQALDSNGDGVLTQADDAWGDLGLWVDGNADGVSQTDELKTLDSVGITQLDLTSASTASFDNGNLIGLTSSYEMQDGSVHQMADVWFRADKAPASSTDTVLQGKVSSLVDAMASYPDTPNAALPGIAPMIPAANETPVAGSMAGILGNFDANGNLLNASPLMQCTALPGVSCTTLPAGTAGANPAHSRTLAAPPGECRGQRFNER